MICLTRHLAGSTVLMDLFYTLIKAGNISTLDIARGWKNATLYKVCQERETVLTTQ